MHFYGNKGSINPSSLMNHVVNLSESEGWQIKKSIRTAKTT